MTRNASIMLGCLFALFVFLGFRSAQETEIARSAAQSPAADPSIFLTEVANGFDQPLAVVTTDLPDDERLFVVEKKGRIWIVYPDGTREADPFLDISSWLRTTSEMGLLGLAFDPDFASNGRFYINYNPEAEYEDMKTHVSRFTLNSPTDNTVNLATEEKLLTVDQDYDNHNGGDLHFGPDGYFYIFFGDGGSGNDPDQRAQDINTILGSIVRIDVRQSTTGGLPDCGTGNYRIPADNPFVDTAGCDEIWAYGVRNPWRASFDRDTGDLLFGDVGQGAQEELNYQVASSHGGEDYGWRCFEGEDPNPSQSIQCDPGSDYVPPFFDYGRTLGRSVTGGYVYRGDTFPNLEGTYVFADFSSGRFWLSRKDQSNQWQTTESIDTGLLVSSFGEDRVGDLYVVDLNGTLYRLRDQVGLKLALQPLAPVFLGNHTVLTIDLENRGGASAANPVVSVRLPSNVTHVSGGTLSGQLVTFDLDSLDVDAKVTVSMTVSTTTGFTPELLTVSADGIDPINGELRSTSVVGQYNVFTPLIVR